MNIIYYIFIFPLRFLMNLILNWSYSFTDSVGMSILILSLIVNTVLLPLYYLAEKWQNKERGIQNLMRPRLKKINEEYKGEEKYNQTVALYKEHKYHPIQSLRTSFGFLIQVPFFIAAYMLLSHNELLESSSFFFLKDLGAPDGILTIKNLTVNIMPVLMTAVNLVSSAVYATSLTRGEKIKLAFIALIFLVLLYKSPSGLVLYWTLNNIYSLVKNIIHNPVKK